MNDQLKKSDLLQSEMERYKKELENERRKSDALEGDFKKRAKNF